MNTWIKRGLQTALLAGGLLTAGVGTAAADENDLSADVFGVTATVPVDDGSVAQTPVITGHGDRTTVEDGEAGTTVPANTNTEEGTTVLDEGEGGASAPVYVREADDSVPDRGGPVDATVPANTSGGGEPGTTISMPVPSDEADVPGDGDGGTDASAEMSGPLGSEVGGDVDGTAPGRDTDTDTAPGTVVELPASLENGEPTVVVLPLPQPGAGGDAAPGVGLDVREPELPGTDDGGNGSDDAPGGLRMVVDVADGGSDGDGSAGNESGAGAGGSDGAPGSTGASASGTVDSTEGDAPAAGLDAAGLEAAGDGLPGSASDEPSSGECITVPGAMQPAGSTGPAFAGTPVLAGALGLVLGLMLAGARTRRWSYRS